MTTITTPDELDALPDRTIVRGDDGRPWHLIWHDAATGRAVWATEGRYTTFPSTAAGLLPAAVLFRPDAPTHTPAGDDQPAALARHWGPTHAFDGWWCGCGTRVSDSTNAGHTPEVNAAWAAHALAARRPSAPTVTTEQRSRAARAMYDENRNPSLNEDQADSLYAGRTRDAYLALIDAGLAALGIEVAP